MHKLKDFSLSGVKTFRGMEGGGLNAFLTLKGKKIAEVIDDGNGGEMYVRFAKNHDGKMYFTAFDPPADVAEFLAGPEALKIGNDRESKFRKQYPGLYTKEPMPTEWGITDFVEYLLEQHEEQKEIKRMSKRYGFLYRIPGTPGISYFKVPKNHRWTKAYYETLLAKVKSKHKDIEILAEPELKG